jgi:hypothetical protein
MLFISLPAKVVPILKRGISFNLSSGDENIIVSYILEMQLTGIAT